MDVLVLPGVAGQPLVLTRNAGVGPFVLQVSLLHLPTRRLGRAATHAECIQQSSVPRPSDCTQPQIIKHIDFPSGRRISIPCPDLVERDLSVPEHLALLLVVLLEELLPAPQPATATRLPILTTLPNSAKGLVGQSP